ncbi:MAG: hypothetical protein PWR22_834 [Moorella sp. (in: firmicutes)]|nr:hypothetical protein [Moorella sp. (in: firmicutes)]
MVLGYGSYVNGKIILCEHLPRQQGSLIALFVILNMADAIPPSKLYN